MSSMDCNTCGAVGAVADGRCLVCQTEQAVSKEGTMITLETLLQMPSGDKACAEAQLWFKQYFPTGATLTEAWRKCPNNDWRIWFTVNWVELEQLKMLALRFAGQAAAYKSVSTPELAPFANAITPENVEDAYRIAGMAHEPYTPVLLAIWSSRAVIEGRSSSAVSTPGWAAATAEYAQSVAEESGRERDAVAEQIAWCAEALGI